MMNKRLVGIDFGMKRIGVAISDPMRSFAAPLQRVDRTGDVEKDIALLLKLLQERGEIEMFIIGLPLHLDGTESTMSEAARAFGEKLQEKTGISCEFIDERMTSRAAEGLLIERSMKRKDRAKAVDVVSASLILQTYLDLNCCI